MIFFQCNLRFGDIRRFVTLNQYNAISDYHIPQAHKHVLQIKQLCRLQRAYEYKYSALGIVFSISIQSTQVAFFHWSNFASSLQMSHLIYRDCFSINTFFPFASNNGLSWATLPPAGRPPTLPRGLTSQSVSFKSAERSRTRIHPLPPTWRVKNCQTAACNRRLIALSICRRCTVCTSI